MSDVVIKAEGLGKKYVIGHTSAEKYTTLRDVMARQTRSLARSFGDLVKGRPAIVGDEVEDFWALRDLNFEIRRGDVVGIIGRNGAGKSTLLKILSRITEPTEGRITIRGRVASLLEVGTGFHPELTGRENVFLNGAILGMTRAEIRRKFDEIVAFAEIERFLDTPVKRYSSGMYVRLAFAVAAHLEPEILIVDEVLAVGDAEFQKKCLSRMQNISGEGRTVLFVSHNLAAVQKLCSMGVVLKEGRIVFTGPVGEGILQYSRTQQNAVFVRTGKIPYEVHLNAASADLVVDPQREPVRSLRLRLTIESRIATNVNIDLRVSDWIGAPVAFATLGNTNIETPVELRKGSNLVELNLDLTSVIVGRYGISVDISKPFSHYFDRVDRVLDFEVEVHHWSEVIQPTRQDSGYGSIELKLAEAGQGLLVG